MNEQSRYPVNLSVTLSTLADPAPPTVPEWEFQTVKNWADNWLSKSHPNLGRTGAVCPYSGASIKKNLFRVAFVRGNNLDHDKLVGLLDEIAAAFPVLPPAAGPESIYKAVVVVFPEVTDFGQIDAVQAECKTTFVERGLMVGQFYPGHQQGGFAQPVLPGVGRTVPDARRAAHGGHRLPVPPRKRQVDGRVRCAIRAGFDRR